MLSPRLEWIFLLPSPEPFATGGAMACGLGWFQMHWPDTWTGIEISAKELIPVVAAAAMWGRYWSGKHICFHSDNIVVVSVLQTRASKNTLLMHLLCCFSFYSAYFHFQYSAKNVSGVQNVAADALSHNKLSLFFSVTPQMPQLVPPSLLKLLVTIRPDWGSPSWTQLFLRSLREVSPNPH